MRSQDKRDNKTVAVNTVEPDGMPPMRGQSPLVPLSPGARQVVRATETERSWPVRLGFWFSDRGIDLLIAVGAVIAGVGQLLGRDVVATFLANGRVSKEVVEGIGAGFTTVGILMALVGALAQIRRKPRVSGLENDLKNAQAQIDALQDEKGQLVASVRQLLQRYLTVLGTGQLSFTHSDRITLYVHDRDLSFTRAARFSPNPNFSKSGRVFYPDHEGCIGKAWNQGVFFADDYPDPESDREAYIARCVKDGMAAKVAKSIKMRSRTYAAYSIADKGNHSVAVIVVESLDPSRYNRDELDAIFLGAEPARYLGEMLEIFARDLPDIMNAQKEGF